jgi:hypothetical protein
MRAACALAAAAACSALATPAAAGAKEYGYSTPLGRDIYKDNTTFSKARDTQSRQLVIEVAVGSGPEGNLGLLLGLINLPLRGLEYYLGFGLEVTPSRHYTATVRYVFNIDGWRPFAGLGYLYNDVYGIGTYSHNVFAEVGYKWIVHQTYHLTLGVGVRRLLDASTREDSLLRGGDVDQAWLERELDSLNPWVPQAALRFSRAF